MGVVHLVSLKLGHVVGPADAQVLRYVELEGVFSTYLQELVRAREELLRIPAQPGAIPVLNYALWFEKNVAKAHLYTFRKPLHQETPIAHYALLCNILVWCPRLCCSAFYRLRQQHPAAAN